MRDDLQLVQKTEGARVRHAFLMPPPPPAATVERICISFGLQQQISVLLPLPSFPLSNSRVPRNAADHRILFSKSWLWAWTTLRC
jgi:hypothetical protein